MAAGTVQKVVGVISEQFQEWASIVAGQLQARLTVVDDTVQLRPSVGAPRRGRGATNLMSEPDTPDAWRTRLTYIEKAAAEEIKSGPAAFSCSAAEGRAHGRGTDDLVDVVRVAFGLSLSLGKSCGRRYTAYFLPDIEQGSFIAGRDELPGVWTEVSRLDLRQVGLRPALEHWLGMLGEVAIEYRSCAAVAGQLANLNAGLASELRDLDRLYTTRGGEFAYLLGQAKASLRGEDAIESEYLTRMEDILGKYTVGILLRVLSIGIVRCRAKVRTQGRAVSVLLPFLDRTLDLARRAVPISRARRGAGRG